MDVLCVGAGIAGLYAAVTLALHGRKVLLVEHHSKPGGCCSSFKRKSFTFDAGPHLFTGLNDLGSIAVLLDRVGVSVPARRFDPMEVVYFGEDVYRLPDGIHPMRAYLKSRFPAEASAIDGLFRDVQRIYFKGVRTGRPDRSLFEMTFRSYFEQFLSDPVLVSLLTSQWPYLGCVPARAVAFPMLSMATSYWHEGVFYPMGGSQALADALYHRFTEAGGLSLFYHDAIEIEQLRDGVAVRVMDRAGGATTTVSGGHLVFNGSEHLFAQLAKLPAKVSDDLERTYVSGGAPLMLYLGLGRPMPHIQGIYYDNIRISDPDSGCFVVGNPTNHDPSLARGSGGILTVYEPFPEPPADVSGWSNVKAWAQERAMKRLCARFPGLESNIEVLEAAGPNTIERYTLNTRGSAYGHTYDIDHAIPGGSFVPLDHFGEHVTLAGHWTFPGGGVNAAMISGWIGAKRVLGSGAKAEP